jgi:DNA-binding GntR family transcriptional regulator
MPWIDVIMPSMSLIYSELDGSASEDPGWPRGAPLADRAYSLLRDRIITLQIPPGAPINEDALRRELGLGRTPIREAVKRLALENLISVFPRRGTFASDINITDLSAISDVREVLEGHAAFRAAERLTDAQREELAELVALLATDGDAGHPETLMSRDAAVHRFIYRAANNPYLEATLSRYFNLSMRIWYLVLSRVPSLSARVHEHSELLKVIADGDAARARDIMTEHVALFAREMRAVL